MEIVVINPGFIFGPTFINRDSSSLELLKNLMNGKYPGLAKISIPIVDVREVAKAHLFAIIKPEAANHRIIVSNKALWLRDIALILY
jgi:dihydroflavonol-4-reductase